MTLLRLMVLVVAGAAVIWTSPSQARSVRVLDLERHNLVYLSNLDQSSGADLPTLTYNEIVEWAPNYIFVSQMTANCAQTNTLRTDHLMAFHTPSLQSRHSALSPSERRWKRYPKTSAEAIAWSMTCQHKDDPKNIMEMRTMFDLFLALRDGHGII